MTVELAPASQAEACPGLRHSVGLPARPASAWRKPASVRPGSGIGARPVRERLAIPYASERAELRVSGSMSATMPRSQMTRTRPRSEMSSTTPRSPAHSPDGPASSATSSILVPTETPALMRAARRRAPSGIHGAVIGSERPDLDPFRRTLCEEDLPDLAKIPSPAGRSELDGLGSVRRQTTAAGGYHAVVDEGATRLTPSPSPEDRLDDLLLQRRRELDAQVARLVETVTGLERREELVRDSRASVERVLRVGANDLDIARVGARRAGSARWRLARNDSGPARTSWRSAGVSSAPSS